MKKKNILIIVMFLLSSMFIFYLSKNNEISNAKNYINIDIQNSVFSKKYQNIYEQYLNTLQLNQNDLIVESQKQLQNHLNKTNFFEKLNLFYNNQKKIKTLRNHFFKNEKIYIEDLENKIKDFNNLTSLEKEKYLNIAKDYFLRLY